MLTRPYYEYPSVDVVSNVVRGWSLIVFIKILPPAFILACTNSSQRKIELIFERKGPKTILIEVKK